MVLWLGWVYVKKRHCVPAFCFSIQVLQAPFTNSFIISAVPQDCFGGYHLHHGFCSTLGCFWFTFAFPRPGESARFFGGSQTFGHHLHITTFCFSIIAFRSSRLVINGTQDE